MYLSSPQLALYPTGLCGGVLSDMEKKEMTNLTDEGLGQQRLNYERLFESMIHEGLGESGSAVTLLSRRMAEHLLAELSHLQKLCEEQKAEIERLKEAHADCEKPNWTDPELVSQLATQTERVRLLEKELTSMIGSHGEPCADLIRGMGDCSAVKSAKQALNQERLGDGK